MKLLLRWCVMILLIGIFSGAASAVFLHALYWATDCREANVWIIALLPLAGLFIGWSYYRYGKAVVKGNDLVIEQYQKPDEVIPFRMAPMVLLGTVVTHLFGGSAGREGTAIQMGAAIADRFTRWFSLPDFDRKLILMMGMSGGFASVFGTPWAAAIFAFEVLRIDSFRWKRIMPIVFVAFIAHYTCLLMQVHHTEYAVDLMPEMTLINVLWAVLAGLVFGLAAMFFSQSNRFFKMQFSRWITYPPLRPVVGGMLIAFAVYLMGTTKYIGLGIPTIVEAFENPLPYYDFLIKTVLTTFTLGAGFKGGEVTPLFFVGATLGNALAMYIPLPLVLLAGMGFVAVFAGATNTPIACSVMGLELFGISGGWFFTIGCVVAYIFSGQKGIYTSQPQMFLKVRLRRIR